MPARRFIAPQARAGNGHGYLTQPPRPLPIVADPPEVVERIASATSTTDEPEAPSPAWVEAAADLHRTYDKLRFVAQVEQTQQIRRTLTVENRMAEARRVARLRNINARSEFTAIARMLEHARMERTDHRRTRLEAAAERRLAGVEARLDQLPDDLAA